MAPGASHKGGGKAWRYKAPKWYKEQQSSSQPTFPSFEEMPTAGRAETSTSWRAPAQLDLADGDIGQDCVQGVQRILNGIRKATGRSRKLAEEREELEVKWERYQKNLRAAFLKERQKYMDRKAKIQAEIAETATLKEAAVAELKEIFQNPMAARKPKESEPVPEEALTEFAALLRPDSTDGTELDSFLADALGDKPVTGGNIREHLMKLVRAHKTGTAAPATPPRRGPTVPAMTPPARKERTRHTNMDVDVAADPYQGETVVQDPYLTSPSTRTLMPSPAAEERHSRSRSHARTPIKNVGRKPQAPSPSSGGLSEKLERRREAELGKRLAEQTVIEDSEEDEKDFLADLAGKSGANVEFQEFD